MSALAGQKRPLAESPAAPAAPTSVVSAASVVDPWGEWASPALTLALPSPAAAAAAATDGAAPALAASNSAQLLLHVLRAELSAVRSLRASRARFVDERLRGSLALDAAAAGAVAALAAGGGGGGGGGDAATAAAAAAGEEEEQSIFPPRYTGRPLRGYTSASLYLAGEAYAGFPPPARDRWRDSRAGSLLAAAFLPDDAAAAAGGGGAAAAASAAMGLLNPAVARAAEAALRSPLFPDRAYPPAATGGGSRHARALAIAADLDAAAADEALDADAQEQTLVALIEALEAQEGELQGEAAA